jgi:hypothetical protein
MFTITISSAAGLTPEDTSYTIVEEIRIEIDAKSPRPFSEFSKRVYACRDLFAVVCLSLCDVQELRLYPLLDHSARRHFQAATFHASPIFRERKSDRPTSWHDLLFRRSDVSSERLRDIFSTWLMGADRLHVVRSLYHAGSCAHFASGRSGRSIEEHHIGVGIPPRHRNQQTRSRAGSYASGESTTIRAPESPACCCRTSSTCV